MHEVLDRPEGHAHKGRAIGFRASGTLRKEDYDDMTALLHERIDRYGEVRIFFEMKDFDGWKPRALWEDVKFDVKHNQQITRAAIVGGGGGWENALTKLAALFAHADVRYFDLSEREAAWRWLLDDA